MEVIYISPNNPHVLTGTFDVIFNVSDSGIVSVFYNLIDHSASYSMIQNDYGYQESLSNVGNRWHFKPGLWTQHLERPLAHSHGI